MVYRHVTHLLRIDLARTAQRKPFRRKTREWITAMFNVHADSDSRQKRGRGKKARGDEAR